MYKKCMFTLWSLNILISVLVTATYLQCFTVLCFQCYSITTYIIYTTAKNVCSCYEPLTFWFRCSSLLHICIASQFCVFSMLRYTYIHTVKCTFVHLYKKCMFMLWTLNILISVLVTATYLQCFTVLCVFGATVYLHT